MHIALVNPCYPHRKKRYDEEKNPGVFAPPLGLAYLAAPLIDRGYKVDLVDLCLDDLRPKEGAKRLLKLDPDVVGLSCNMSFNYEMALEVGRIYRDAGGRAKIVAGGNHATFEHIRLLSEEPTLDFIVRGEGEVIFPMLIEALSNESDPYHIPGISFRDQQGIRSNPPPPPVKELDNLLPPARSLLNLSRFGTDSRGLLISSRGCPFACSYCSTSAFSGTAYRTHSISRILSEAQELVNEHNVNHLMFMDDIFTLNRSRVIEFCTSLKNLRLGVTWACDTRVDTVDAELLELMATSGCTSIFFGIESVNQQALDIMGKGFLVKQAERACIMAAEAGIDVQQSYILGLPSETPQSIGGIVDFVQLTKPARVLLNFFTAYPGTPVYHDPSSFGLKTFFENWSNAEQANPMVLTHDLGRDDILRSYVDLVFRLDKTGMLKW